MISFDSALIKVGAVLVVHVLDYIGRRGEFYHPLVVAKYIICVVGCHAICGRECDCDAISERGHSASSNLDLSAPCAAVLTPLEFIRCAFGRAVDLIECGGIGAAVI